MIYGMYSGSGNGDFITDYHSKPNPRSRRVGMRRQHGYDCDHGSRQYLRAPEEMFSRRGCYITESLVRSSCEWIRF